MDGTILPMVDLPFISESNPFTAKTIKNENDILKLKYHKYNLSLETNYRLFNPSCFEM